jgi:y4mF family transcriptional regulator
LIVAQQPRIFPLGNIMTSLEFGRIIKENRLAQGLRQDQLAAAAGVGLRFLIELERGKPTAQLGKSLAILDALGCQVEIRSSHQGLAP